MQFTSAIILSIMASLAIASPLDTRGGKGGSSSYTPCGSSVLLDSQAVCCSTDVLSGVADLSCATVSETPESADDFAAICAKSGQTAECCTLSVLGIALLCATPVGL
ncbi:Cryparin [Cytospora mali]|uniref:Cryparin n=1 Tax=Cytospora mali TaxID=578113 RepID=A0A194UVB7_CYTMA|nr:Cryparin [Valsa mali var. pyri (nom. inval.)]